MSTIDDIGSNSDSYLQQLIKLSPPGFAFPNDLTSKWAALLGVIADTCARVDANAVLLVDESFPDTTTVLLPNWERVAGIPDECTELGESIQIRRQNLLAKLAARGGATKQYLIDVATILGFTITITEFDEFRVDLNAVGDPLLGEDWEYTFQVNAPAETITWFRTDGSSVGDPLASWGNDRLECVINRLKPAHTIAIFAYA